MPIYQYICDDCKTVFDELRSFKDSDSSILCKTCHSERTRRKPATFFAQSGGKSVTKQAHSCGGCSGGSCASCSH